MPGPVNLSLFTIDRFSCCSEAKTAANSGRLLGRKLPIDGELSTGSTTRKLRVGLPVLLTVMVTSSTFQNMARSLPTVLSEQSIVQKSGCDEAGIGNSSPAR